LLAEDVGVVLSTGVGVPVGRAVPVGVSSTTRVLVGVGRGVSVGVGTRVLVGLGVGVPVAVGVASGAASGCPASGCWAIDAPDDSMSLWAAIVAAIANTIHTNKVRITTPRV
jgi:hypothetical protein